MNTGLCVHLFGILGAVCLSLDMSAVPRSHVINPVVAAWVFSHARVRRDAEREHDHGIRKVRVLDGLCLGTWLLSVQ
jgi:hypothetical protein